jgi:hypothetical protein
MTCKHCGQPIDLDKEHQCIVKEKYNQKTISIIMPPAPHRSSPSLDQSVLSLSGNHPEHITLEQVLDFKQETEGFIKEVLNVVKIWKKFVKKPTKQNIILIICGVIAFILWFWTKYAPGGFNYMPPTGLKAVFSFLTASFNNVPSRILHFSALVTLVSAFLPAILGGQYEKVIANVNGVIQLIIKVISYKKSQVFYTLIIAAGAGLFFTNYMMRNNSINKYFACFTLGTMIMLSTSGLFKSTFVRLMKGLLNDITKLLKIKDFYTKYQIAIQLGFGGGLVLSIVSSLIRDISSSAFTDNLGYFLGFIVFVTGITLSFQNLKLKRKAV